MNRFFAAVAISLLPAFLAAATYHVDMHHPDAADTNPGTEQQPWKTLAPACEKAVAGDTVLVKPGVYREYLAPRNSGAQGAPITFQGFGEPGEVAVKGSDAITGWERDGEDWVKRPWRKRMWWSESLLRLSEDPFKTSSRQEQVFVDGKRLQWMPDVESLQVNSFCWAEDASELRLRLPEGVDPNTALVEVPLRDSTLCAWPNMDVRTLKMREELVAKDPAAAAKMPLIDHIVVRGFTFAHNAATINRSGVRLQGNHWVFEDNIVEWMNTLGLTVGGAHAVIRNNITRFCGQSGFGGSGDDVLYEDNISLWNNAGLFRTGWGGAADKWGHTSKHTVRRHITLGGGSGIWFDIDCVDTLIEDCVVLPNHITPAGGAHGGIFYEVSYDAVIRNNVVFGNLMSTGRTAYGAGVTISSSAQCLVERNVLIFCQNGLGLVGGRRNPGTAGRFLEKYGQGDAYHAMNNVFRDNLIIFPRSTDIFISADDSTTAHRNNRFLNNTALTRADQVTTQFGKQTVQLAMDMDKFHPISEGQSVVHEPAALDRADQERLNWAAGRVMYGINRAVGLDLDPDTKVTLLGLWQFPGRVSQGMWVRAGDEHFLIIDGAADEELTLASSSGGNVRFWVSRDAQWKPLPDQIVHTVPVRQGLTIVSGLAADTRPAGGVDIWAEQHGQRAQRLDEGKPFRWALRIANYENTPRTVRIEGAGFQATSQEIAPGRSILLHSPEQPAAKGDAQGTVTVRIGDEQPLTLTARASTFAPVMAAAVPNNYFGTDEMMYSSPPPVVINDKKQMVPELYDLATGVGWNGEADLSAAARIGWNPQGFWVYADVKDDHVLPAAIGNAPWDGDAIEIFLDSRTEELGRPAYAPGVLHYFVRAPQKAMSDWSDLPIEGSGVPEGAKAKGRVIQSGYQIEVFVPWAAFPEGIKTAQRGRVLGFDLGIDDGDDTTGKTGRRTQFFWQGSGNNFNDASGFGRIQLD